MDLDDSYHKSEGGSGLRLYGRPKISHSILKPIGFVGLGVFYVAVAGQGVPHLTSLGLSESQISLALISGPLCGAVLQPLFGSWSDRYHSTWGRRKPFIVFGAIWLVISTLCLAWARSITDMILSHTVEPETQHVVLSTFSIFTVFSMYAAVQAIQIGMRALITDGCSLAEQANSNAWAGRYIGVGGMLGNLAALLDDLSGKIEKVQGRTILMDLSAFTIFCLILSLVVSCSFKSEDDQVSVLKNPSKVRKSHGARKWNLLKGTSGQFQMICLVQFFAWLGWFPFYFYTVTYVDGLSEAQDTQRMLSESKKRVWESEAAPRLGSFTFFAYSTVSLLMALFLPYLSATPSTSHAPWMKKQQTQQHSLITMPRLWMLSHAVFGSCMLSTFFVTSASGTAILFTIVGFSWAVSNWIPYALLGAEISQTHRPRLNNRYNNEAAADSGNGGREGMAADAGVIYGLHGLAVCLPQIFMALVMGAVSLYTEPGSVAKRNLEIVWTFRAGGIFAFIAMFCTMWVRDLGDIRERPIEMDESCESLLSDPNH